MNSTHPQEIHVCGHSAKPPYRGRLFQTWIDNLPRTCGVVIDPLGIDSAIRADDLQGLANAAAHNPLATARGKIAIVRRDGIHVFQSKVDGEVAPAFCGHATAAAIRYLGGSQDIHVAVHGTSTTPYDVRARVSDKSVAQTWLIPPVVVEERAWRGRRTLLVSSLNNYAIIVGTLPPAISSEDARRELVGAELATKLAVVTSVGATPFVEFHNSNGRHGAAPQTGLATIALAACTVEWFGRLFADRRVAYQTVQGRREEFLPSASSNHDGRVALAMPTVVVELAPDVAIDRYGWHSDLERAV